jgi:hypothetical protein
MRPAAAPSSSRQRRARSVVGRNRSVAASVIALASRARRERLAWTNGIVSHTVSTSLKPSSRFSCAGCDANHGTSSAVWTMSAPRSTLASSR